MGAGLSKRELRGGLAMEVDPAMVGNSFECQSDWRIPSVLPKGIDQKKTRTYSR